MAGLASACLLFSVYGFSITVSPGSGLLHIAQQNPVVIFVTCLMALTSILSLVLLFLLPTRQMRVLHAVPCSPFVPLTSIFTNIYLLTNLSRWTWARFAAWIFIGKCFAVSCMLYDEVTLKKKLSKARPGFKEVENLFVNSKPKNRATFPTLYCGLQEKTTKMFLCEKM